MKYSPKRDQDESLSNETKITILLLFMGTGLLLLIVLLALLLRGYVQPGTAQAPGIPTSAPMAGAPPTSGIPTILAPTPDCGTPTLVIGATTFQIQTISPSPDGSFSVPSDSSGAAYWVQGTDNHPVFILSPTFDNLTLFTTLRAGSPVTARWADCSSTTHTLDAPTPGSLNAASLPDQSSDGITLFFQTDSTGNGFVMSGSLTGEQTGANAVPSLTVENTQPPVVENTQPPAAQIIASPVAIDTQPASGGNIPPPSGDVQAEITLLEGISSDGLTLRIGVSIYNFGSSAFTLTVNDVALTPTGGAPLSLVDSQPVLPKQVAPGTTETIYFTFPRPTAATATLRVFTVEYDIEGY